MFSARDISDIFRALPPEADPNRDHGIPPLMLSSSGQGFVTVDYARDEFERLVSVEETPQLSPDEIAKELGLTTDVVLQMARASPTALVTRDNYIITKTRRAILEQELLKLLLQQLVSVTQFCTETNISAQSVDSLVQTLQRSYSHNCLQGSVESSRGFMASKAYQLKLSEALDRHLNESLRETRSVDLNPDLLPGDPPRWFISEVLESVLRETDKATKFHVSEVGDVIRCVPKESLLRMRDVVVSELQSGVIPSLDVGTMYTRFGELYPSPEEAKDHLRSIPDTFLLENMAISDKWLTTLNSSHVDEVKQLGYTNFTPTIKKAFPADCYQVLFNKVEQRISAAFSQGTEGEKLLRVGDYLVTTTTYDKERGLLLHSVTTYAADRWLKLKDNTDLDLKFQPTGIISILPEEHPIVSALFEDSHIKKDMEETYWSEISTLEAQNEAEFSDIWVERLLSKMKNHRQGLKAIADEKLQGQLSQLLCEYLTKDLIPDSISKARSHGSVRSRKTRKNVQKLETALQKTGDLPSLLTAIEKFNKKQDIQEPDATSLKTMKQALVSDMVRRMQKQTDGPTLFLVLVIVLIARCSEGVVYATGKYAPKLMKILKPSLDARQYEQLEKWKESAKTSSLTVEDKEGMRHMAKDDTNA